MTRAMDMLYKTADEEDKKKNKPINPMVAGIGGGIASGIVSGVANGVKSKYLEHELTKKITNFEKKNRVKLSDTAKSKIIRSKHVRSILLGGGASFLASLVNSRIKDDEKVESKKSTKRVGR